ncbi:SEFIR domain-containing protein [Nostoc sp. ChiQUE01b]|uniref:VMAP-C domain-containing protein n=1 Tax=Nostoc sp. ChiQUE01b TaxID=3075376 RepID=UPI002AD1F456|nr:SEFIR domain-containing protein [Nostoc sp. ChiQUE01b]MDZ8259608.1 SEFIR domain-containing protein [Nostoc sp. ChiQUE01b]
MNLNSVAPKVFISYSHDSAEHKDRVLHLANNLRDEGVDCKIDQYEQSPSEGWPRWMMNQLEWADFIVVVCTKQYKRRFEGKEEPDRGRGVIWEGAIITQELYNHHVTSTRFVPVVFFPEDENFIPIIISGFSWYKLFTEEGYEAFYRYLTNQPMNLKPPLGEKLQLASRTLPPDNIKLKLLRESYENKRKIYEKLVPQRTETDNSEVKEEHRCIYEEINTIEKQIKKLETLQHPLIEILTSTLNPSILSIIKTAYQSCCSGNLPKIIPSTVEAILIDLHDIDKGKTKFNHNDYTTLFIKSLITDSNIPTEISDKLKRWGNNNIEDFDKIIKSLTKQDYPNIDKPSESYILVKIELLKAKTRSKITKFTLNGWVITNIKNYINNNQNYYKIDFSKSPNESFQLDDIPKIFNALLSEKIPACLPIEEKLGKDITVVFFLPTEYLNYPVEQWEINDFGETGSVGEKCRVIVRDVNRLDKNYLCVKKERWIHKWSELQNICRDKSKCSKFKVLHQYDASSFSFNINEDIGIILNIFDEHIKNDADKVFGSLRSNVIPIAICHRDKILLKDYQMRENNDLNCCIHELPEKVRKNRFESRVNGKKHLLGNDIFLIWEDPNLLTPEAKLIIIN